MTHILSPSEMTSIVKQLSQLSEPLNTSETIVSVEETACVGSVGTDELTPVTKCCLKKKCYERVLAETQNYLFNCFWRIGDYAKQNYYLVGLMAAQSPKQVTSRPLKKNKSLSWKYWVDIRGRKVQVCKGFFLAVYGVSDKRLRVLQTKLVNGEPLEDQRGKYDKERRANQHTIKKDKINKTTQNLTPTQIEPIIELSVGSKSGKKRKQTTTEENLTEINSNNEIILNELIIPQNFM